MTNLPYRPDIDGLRALAVLLVVGFHAFPSLLPGGFIGVDLFFVISGYLISSILYQGLSSQNFSFLTFYGRRIRRIFPALIVVLATCYAFGWFALFADEYALLGKHMASGAGFVANYLLWFEAGYFDSAADTKPLLHLWSLGIEEQFYLVWPFVLWVIYYCGQKYPKAQSFTNPLLLTIGIAILSFVLNIRGINVRHDLVATFYSAQTRFWELLFGAILAYVTLFPKAVDKPGDFVGRSLGGSVGRSLSNSPGWFRGLKERLREHVAIQALSRYQSILGLSLIAVGALLITPTSSFPGWWALLPTLGAVLLIRAGPHAFINRSLLSNKGMVWIGLISYPLYLWHWPILSLLRIVKSEPLSVELRISAVVLSLILATLTYRFIEKPIRYGFKSQSQAAKAKWQSYVTGILIILMIAVGYVGWNTYEREGLGFRNKDRDIYGSYFMNLPPDYHYFQRINYQDNFRQECDFLTAEKKLASKNIAPSCTQAIEGKQIVLLWGDSHAQQLHEGLQKNLPSNWQILVVASSACAPFVVEKPSLEPPFCERSNQLALNTIAKVKPDIVIIAQNKSHQIDNLNAVAKAAVDNGAHQVLIAGPTPHWGNLLYKTIQRYLWTFTPKRTWKTVDTEFISRNKVFSAALNQPPNILYIDIIGLFCDDSGCTTYVDEDKQTGLTTFDDAHLSPAASIYLAKKLIVPMILKNSTK